MRRSPARTDFSARRTFRNSVVKEGYKFGVPPLALGGVLLAIHWYWAGGILIFLGLFVFYFFRDPERAIPAGADNILSPADGRVVEIVDEEFDSVPGRRISIFLAVWNVHIQRAPVPGRIANVVYRPGRFYGAFRAKASQLNEQNVVYIDSPQSRVVFKQIAGAIARRVLCWKSKGETVALGERVGMIRFGSRVDVWLPATTQLVVRLGQNVKGGESILAKWNSTA